MVENQHRKMKTYRDLTEEEIYNINAIKDLEEDVARFFNALKTINDVDQRWLSIGRTHLQEGFSALVRAIARPDNPFEDQR